MKIKLVLEEQILENMKLIIELYRLFGILTTVNTDINKYFTNISF